MPSRVRRSVLSKEERGAAVLNSAEGANRNKERIRKEVGRCQAVRGGGVGAALNGTDEVLHIGDIKMFNEWFGLFNDKNTRRALALNCFLGERRRPMAGDRKDEGRGQAKE